MQTHLVRQVQGARAYQIGIRKVKILVEILNTALPMQTFALTESNPGPGQQQERSRREIKPQQLLHRGSKNRFCDLSWDLLLIPTHRL